MPPEPLAYFLTFGSYGSRLHGDPRGSVDRHHEPILRDDFRAHFEARLMVSGGFAFEPAHRATLEVSIAETCSIRRWRLWALNIRLAHVHVVVSGDSHPDLIMQALKANGTRLLRERTGLAPEQRVWARHGSTRYLWDVDAVAAAVDYTLNRQGATLPGSAVNNWRRESVE